MPQYFKLRKKAHAGRAVRDQPDRLGRAQGRRAAALDPPGRRRAPRAGERLPALAPGGARLPPGEDPRGRRHRPPARAGRAPRRERRQGPGVLRRPRGEAPRGRPRPRLRRASTSAATRRPRRSARSSTSPAAFAPDDWRSFVPELRYPFDDEFYLFEPDPDSGLSSDTVSAAYLESKRRRRTDLRVPLSTASAGGCTTASSRPRHRSSRPAGRLPRAREGAARRASRRARGRAGGEGARSSAASTAATARCPRSRTSAPSRSARRTSATAPAAGRARGSARSTTASASGRRRTSG